MTDVMPEQQAVDLDELVGGEPAGADVLDAVDEQLIARLAGRAREGGLALTGEGGLLAQLTKRLVESALEGEITDHLGYDRHNVAGRDGGNSRNGHRSKTVLTEVGPVEIDVPRDRDGSFEPKIVAKRKRRLSGVDELVISLACSRHWAALRGRAASTGMCSPAPPPRRRCGSSLSSPKPIRERVQSSAVPFCRPGLHGHRGGAAVVARTTRWGGMTSSRWVMGVWSSRSVARDTARVVICSVSWAMVVRLIVDRRARRLSS